ncbi:hypothetical protein M1446_02020 [Candidatus Dependentiae bacterium]|nr:hypothetical protein [Candidatus Dependentiae bacterium]
MKNFLKAILLVTCISSLNAGYFETALSYIKFSQEKFVAGFQATQRAADKAFDLTSKQMKKFEDKIDTNIDNSIKAFNRFNKTSRESIKNLNSNDEVKQKINKTGMLICVLGTTGAALYEFFKTKN